MSELKTKTIASETVMLRLPTAHKKLGLANPDNSVPHASATVSPGYNLGSYLDRKKSGMNNSFMPSATGAFVLSDEVLIEICHLSGRTRPSGWFPGKCGTYSKQLGDYLLWVRGCDDHWIVERSSLKDGTDEILSFVLGGWPILTTRYQLAMRVAERCSPQSPSDFGYLSWIPDQ